jgi:formylglycine-generating enzyme required for sulfatase activity/serine/threonine protein kinase
METGRGHAGQGLPPGSILGEFKILRELGSGGFGITYLAWDLSLERQVVIKENLPVFAVREGRSGRVEPRSRSGEDAELLAWSLESFLREARTLARFDHPNIVKVLRVFEGNGTAYFVMPFVEGETLGERIGRLERAGERLGAGEVERLLGALLHALETLHGAGVYHRDIKPGNILVTGSGEPVLIDFGAAREMVGQRSQTVIESPGYTPFEQMQSRGEVGPWSDLYGLGATLYRVLTGKPPSRSADRVLGDPVLRLSGMAELRGRYPARLLETIDRALAPAWQDRFRSAGEWREALRGNGTMGAERRAEPPPLPPVPPAPVPVPVPGSRKSPPAAPRTSGKSKVGPGAVAAIVVGAAGAALFLGWALSSSPAPEEGDVPEDPPTAVAPTPPSRASSFEGRRAGETKVIGGIEMVWCPRGTFLMGSPMGEEAREASEIPHAVTLTRGFWLAKTECTQAQWQAVMGTNPSHFTGSDRLPVEQVTWDEVMAWCERMDAAARDVPEGWRWTLPTEAQWEYACRAGTTTPFSFGSRLNGQEANCNGSFPYGTTVKGPFLERTAEAGSFAPNPWGFLDMHGNVYEWCRDWYGAYPGGPATDPSGADSGSQRVFRGGGWIYFAKGCRSAARYGDAPGIRFHNLGFRPAVCLP